MNKASPVNADIATLSFESAMTELEQIVRDMESGKTTLEQAISAYERGVALRTHCEKRLNNAQMRIDQITKNADGTVRLSPAQIEKS